jgi:AbrB family looped-hinge helix DNA binding protein
MSSTVEIDKAGRIVVPKKLRDALHLIPGTRLKVERSGDTLTLEPDFPERRLEMIDGLWVMTGGDPTPIDIPESIRQGYEERNKRIMEGSGLE